MCGIITPILGVVSSALAMANARQTNKASENQQKYQAEVAANTAKAKQIEAQKIKADVQEGETALRKQQASNLGAQRSLLASQGYALSDIGGSAATYLMQESGNNEEDALRYREEGEHAVWQAENDVYISQANANNEARKSTDARTSSLLSTGKGVSKEWYGYVKE